MPIIVLDEPLLLLDNLLGTPHSNVGDHRLRLLFDNGTVGYADFSGMEWAGVFEPLKDAAFFAQVRVDPEAATVVWPNDADMAPEPLY